MDLKLFLAILIGKIVKFLTTIFQTGGTAAPGLAAITIDKKLILKLCKNNQIGSIVITGTNGKTTTARMLAEIFSQVGKKPIHNRAGSNLLRGVASALIEVGKISGKIDNNLAIWEADEAVMPELVSQTNPKVLLISNLFRDQLDRFGEIDKLRRIWAETVKNLGKNQVLILNSDDPQIAFLGKQTLAKVLYYTLSVPSFSSKELPKAADAKFCPNCGTSLNYQAVYVYHMGEYSCPNCFLKKPKAEIMADKISELKPESVKFQLVTPIGEAWLRLSVGGLYNIYNAIAAATAAFALKINLTIIKNGLENFQAAFGRVERFKIGQKTISLYLVKNPAGFSEVIKTLFVNSSKKDLLIAINDLTADGKDVSWLWDVDFEKLQNKVNKIFLTGKRAYDLALRLKYAQIKKPKLCEQNFEKAVKLAIESCQKQLFILPTYTAMLEIRKVLNRMGYIKKFWED